MMRGYLSLSAGKDSKKERFLASHRFFAERSGKAERQATKGRLLCEIEQINIINIINN